MFASAFTSTSNILKDLFYFGGKGSDPLVRHQATNTREQNNVTFWTAIQRRKTTEALLTGQSVLLIFLLRRGTRLDVISVTRSYQRVTPHSILK